MSLLARPWVTATLALLLAGLLHPLAAEWLDPQPRASAGLAVALLLVAALAAGAVTAVQRTAALGAVAVLLAFGYDSLRGHRGTLDLATGEGRRVFEERTLAGRDLSLRPLGFDLAVRSAAPDGTRVSTKHSKSSRRQRSKPATTANTIVSSRQNKR